MLENDSYCKKKMKYFIMQQPLCNADQYIDTVIAFAAALFLCCHLTGPRGLTSRMALRYLCGL